MDIHEADEIKGVARDEEGEKIVGSRSGAGGSQYLLNQGVGK